MQAWPLRYPDSEHDGALISVRYRFTVPTRTVRKTAPISRKGYPKSQIPGGQSERGPAYAFGLADTPHP